MVFDGGKLNIMQLILNLAPISQATYGTKALQFECKHKHKAESSLIQIIYIAMTGITALLFILSELFTLFKLFAWKAMT